jgi:hypothetical protein
VFFTLLLLAIVPGRAGGAAPPFALIDSRRAWLFNQGSFRPAGIGRWIERGPYGRRVWREHHRARDYIELFDPARTRYIRLYPWGQYAFVPRRKHYAWVCRGRWAHPANRPLNHALNADERDKLTTQDQRDSFPRLNEEYEVLAPASASYNCIGWSLGTTSSWVWPTEGGQPVYLHHFDSLYASHGFRRVARLSFKRVPGMEKIVLYGVRRSDGSGQPTHAAVQMSDGSWSSKLGSLPLIRHLHPNDVAGPSYGAPWVMYVRRRLPPPD